MKERENIIVLPAEMARLRKEALVVDAVRDALLERRKAWYRTRGPRQYRSLAVFLPEPSKSQRARYLSKAVRLVEAVNNPSDFLNGLKNRGYKEATVKRWGNDLDLAGRVMQEKFAGWGVAEAGGLMTTGPAEPPPGSRAPESEAAPPESGSDSRKETGQKWDDLRRRFAQRLDLSLGGKIAGYLDTLRQQGRNVNWPQFPQKAKEILTRLQGKVGGGFLFSLKSRGLAAAPYLQSAARDLISKPVDIWKRMPPDKKDNIKLGAGSASLFLATLVASVYIRVSVDQKRGEKVLPPPTGISEAVEEFWPTVTLTREPTNTPTVTSEPPKTSTISPKPTSAVSREETVVAVEPFFTPTLTPTETPTPLRPTLTPTAESTVEPVTEEPTIPPAPTETIKTPTPVLEREKPVPEAKETVQFPARPSPTVVPQTVEIPQREPSQLTKATKKVIEIAQQGVKIPQESYPWLVCGEIAEVVMEGACVSNDPQVKLLLTDAIKDESGWADRGHFSQTEDLVFLQPGPVADSLRATLEKISRLPMAALEVPIDLRDRQDAERVAFYLKIIVNYLDSLRSQK